MLQVKKKLYFRLWLRTYKEKNDTCVVLICALESIIIIPICM